MGIYKKNNVRCKNLTREASRRTPVSTPGIFLFLQLPTASRCDTSLVLAARGGRGVQEPLPKCDVGSSLCHRILLVVHWQEAALWYYKQPWSQRLRTSHLIRPWYDCTPRLWHDVLHPLGLPLNHQQDWKQLHLGIQPILPEVIIKEELYSFRISSSSRCSFLSAFLPPRPPTNAYRYHPTPSTFFQDS